MDSAGDCGSGVDNWRTSTLKIILYLNTSLIEGDHDVLNRIRETMPEKEEGSLTLFERSDMPNRQYTACRNKRSITVSVEA